MTKPGYTFGGTPIFAAPVGTPDPDKPIGYTLSRGAFTPNKRDIAAIIREVNTAVADFAKHYSRTPDRTTPLRRGDKVEIRRTGYVTHVHPNGSVDLADKPVVFASDAQPFTRGVPRDAVVLTERRPAPPKVGDVISGATLCGTPWRRGTVVTLRSVDGQRDLSSYVLGGDGMWRSLDDPESTYPFADMTCGGDDLDWRVEYAPGK